VIKPALVSAGSRCDEPEAFQDATRLVRREIRPVETGDPADHLLRREAAPEPADAEAMFAYRSHPEVLKYQSWEPQSKSDTRKQQAA